MGLTQIQIQSKISRSVTALGCLALSTYAFVVYGAVRMFSQAERPQQGRAIGLVFVSPLRLPRLVVRARLVQ